MRRETPVERVKSRESSQRQRRIKVERREAGGKTSLWVDESMGLRVGR